METPNPFSEWAIVEMLGHRKLAGQISELPVAGTTMLRLDVPDPDSDQALATYILGAASIYCISVVAEDVVRRLAPRLLEGSPPVMPYQLPPHED